MSQETHFENPPTLDSVAAQRWNAWPHAQSPWLNEEIGRRMHERLEWIKLQPKSWLDWHPLSGGLAAHQAVQQRYPKAQAHVLESTQGREKIAKLALQPALWRRMLATHSTSWGMPEAASMDMVWANMALHLAANPQELLQIWHKTLAVDGFLMFSCLGPDTLKELTQIHAEQGWSLPTHDFTDMHDWGDMLVQAGFAEPVMDMERIHLTYNSPQAFVGELRQLGRNLRIDRFKGLRGKKWHEQFQSNLRRLSPNPSQEPLRITIEVIFGHAIKPLARTKMTPQSEVSLQDMRDILRQSRG
jgi:malonyl-CoA O-methyltransferase